MRFGLILPATGDSATAEGIEAGAATAEALGWSDVWTTDHVLVGRASAADYGRVFEAVTTLAYLAGRTSRIRLGASVIVVPMRNAVILAKELATIDALARGRLIVGVGIGWLEQEFANVGVADRFHLRGAYLDETIALWRHLWSGSSAPFAGRFHAFEDAVFGPLPPQASAMPIWIGGRSEPALRRIGRAADVYHATSSGPADIAGRMPLIRAAAEAAGRPVPGLSARIRVRFPEDEATDAVAIRGSAPEMAATIREFADVGVEHLALAFAAADPEGLRRSMERFDSEVRPLV